MESPGYVFLRILQGSCVPNLVKMRTYLTTQSRERHRPVTRLSYALATVLTLSNLLYSSEFLLHLYNM